ncbi:flavodoxin family protein [Paenibacillus sp. sgz5001063]|uniref:flavodoxin family protein n=1 Tax=Paenibacillus sp. sgz5001063 TaxID=3242474 RepID=UPI0036D2702D
MIHGSMRKGNTYKLTQEVISRLKLHDVEITEINVSELDLPFCMSCHVCFVRGELKCPHYKTMKSVTEKIESCNALILSGVVYSLHLNASMKNLVDHLSYYFHRPRLFDKKGLVITTTAGAGEKTVAKYLKSTMSQWGISNVQTLSYKIQTRPFSLTEKQKKIVDRVSENFYNIILHDKTKEPSMNVFITHNTFRAMSAVDTPFVQYDKSYWKETGLVSKVYPRKVNIFKAAFGVMVFTIKKKVMNKNYTTKK